MFFTCHLLPYREILFATFPRGRGTIGRSRLIEVKEDGRKRNKRRTKPYIGVWTGVLRMWYCFTFLFWVYSSVSVGCFLPCSDMSWEVPGTYKASPVPLFSQLGGSGTARSLFSFLVCYAWKQGGEKLSFFLGNPVCEKCLCIQGLTCRDALPMEEGVGSRQVIQQWNFHGVDWPFMNLSWRVRSLLHR